MLFMRRVFLLAVIAIAAGTLASSATTKSSQPPELIVQKLGGAVVKQVGASWTVTLRYSATVAASATLRLVRDGKFVQSFQFHSGSGTVTVGPVVLTTVGQYRLTVTLRDGAGQTRTLQWTACAGCGERQPPPPPLVRDLGPPRVIKRSDGWRVSVRFQTSRAGQAVMRLVGGGRMMNSLSFRAIAGRVDVGPFVIREPGRYTLSLRLTDAAGRSAGLSWKFLLS
jgi:hypothetical protein